MDKIATSLSLEDQAVLIAGEIFDLTNQYTNDSHIAKFFLPDAVAHACYGLAGGISGMMYNPELHAEEVQGTRVLTFMYALITYGCNIYLKERSFLTNSKPYAFPTHKRVLRKIQKQTLATTSQGKLISTPLTTRIIEIIMENIEHKLSMKEFRVTGHHINRQKFLDYAKLSLYWGYNFATKLLDEKQRE